MTYIAQSHQKSSKRNIERAYVQQAGSVRKRAQLLAELNRQRALLMDRARFSLDTNVESELHSDPVDQASAEFDQGLAMQVKIRTLDKLRRIERALQLMRTSAYGWCHRCHEEIPYKRLMVKPDALFCVPCLTLIEQGVARN
jgi:RNA polymerase-binding protein DksA